MSDTKTATPDQHLVIRGLRVAPLAHPDAEILQGIDLTVGKGEVHAIMGPNGSRGTYALTISGTSGSLTHTVAATLTVTKK